MNAMLVGIFFLAVQSVADEGIIIHKNERTLDQIEQTYSDMPAVQYTPPSDRWKNLQRTRQRLTEGSTLHVVMLGDSIVNDTSRSCWNLLVERDYPKCRLQKTTSVRGSTGCWWYKQPGRVQKFVLEHQPDLVIIGGISQRGDIDSVREVIHQIRAAPKADMLLMTGAFGTIDPRDESQWEKIRDPSHYSSYRKGIESLSFEVGAGFLDMEAAWARYIRQCGEDLEWFKRDPIHANERGEQILGRILAKYFSPLAVAAKNPTALIISTRLELFVDDFLIEEMNGVNLTLHKPIPREVVIVHDAPWEGNTCAYHTVFQDGDIYRMYYRGSHHDTSRQRVCYAESKDGIRWTKPELGLVEFSGSTKNNIIRDGPGSHNFAPFKDSNSDCKPDGQYKALATGEGGLLAFKSSNGIHWSLMSDKPVITEGAFDSQNLAFYDNMRNRYVEFHRGFREDFRDVMTSTSFDFLNWTDPVWLEYPGAAREHLYTNQIISYYRAPHVFLGFPKRFVPSRRAVQHRYAGVSDGMFMTSRDGVTFKRWGEAIIRPGLQKERWVNRNNMTAWGILKTESGIAGTPDELSIYSTEGYYSGPACRLRRFTYRIDGFVSIQAALNGGDFVTKPLVFKGKELIINFSTSAAGSVCVEIRNQQGEPIKGFTLAESVEIYGDEIERVVTWKQGSDLSTLKGGPVRLRFVLKDADLFSIRFR